MLQNRVEIHTTVLLFIAFCFVSVSLPPLAEAAPVKSEYPVSWIFLKLLTGFDPNFAQKPYWAALWSRPSASFDTNRPHSGQPAAAPFPPLAAFICCPSNLQRNVPHHQPSSLLSSLLYGLTWMFYHPAVMHHLFFLQTRYRPWWWLSEFLKGPLWKFPSRKESMGIPFHGVMHNRSLCGGSQPCHSTDQKQIKETEETTMLPLPTHTHIHTRELTAASLTSHVIFLIT